MHGIARGFTLRLLCALVAADVPVYICARFVSWPDGINPGFWDRNTAAVRLGSLAAQHRPWVQVALAVCLSFGGASGY